MRYYRLLNNGGFSRMTRENFENYRDDTLRLYGVGYVALLNIEGAEATVILPVETVRMLQGSTRFPSGGIYPNAITEVEGGELVVNRAGHARPLADLKTLGRPLTPDEITERVSAWRDASPAILAALKGVVEDGFRIGKPKPYRVFYEAGVYEYYKNTGRAALWEYRKRGKLAGAFNVRAGVWSKYV